MMASSSSAADPQARAWFLCAQFHVVEHTRLANSDTDQIMYEKISLPVKNTLIDA